MQVALTSASESLLQTQGFTRPDLAPWIIASALMVRERNSLIDDLRREIPSDRDHLQARVDALNALSKEIQNHYGWTWAPTIYGIICDQLCTCYRQKNGARTWATVYDSTPILSELPVAVGQE